MYIWILDKYGSTSFKQRLWQRKMFFSALWCSGQGVACTGVWSGLDFLRRWFLLALYCSFFLFSFCFLILVFFLSCFPLFLLLTLLIMHLDHENIYFKFKSGEFYFGKGISRALDLHTGHAYGQKKKNISCQYMSLLWNSCILSWC